MISLAAEQAIQEKNENEVAHAPYCPSSRQRLGLESVLVGDLINLRERLHYCTREGIKATSYKMNTYAALPAIYHMPTIQNLQKQVGPS